MAENSFQPFTRRQTMIRRDFEIYRYRYMDEVELHHHDFYEIYMLLRGSVSYTVENRIFHMRAGDLMLISPLELHQARVDSNDEPYERIVLWVDRGYLESLSSPHTSLTRCFDTTVHRYILQKRLLNAKQLLAGGLAPSEVCTYCGFGDYANFYRAFRAEYGTTPRQYVQSLRG